MSLDDSCPLPTHISRAKRRCHELDEDEDAGRGVQPADVALQHEYPATRGQQHDGLHEADQDVGAARHALDEGRQQQEVELGRLPLKHNAHEVDYEGGEEDERGAVVDHGRHLMRAGNRVQQNRVQGFYWVFYTPAHWP